MKQADPINAPYAEITRAIVSEFGGTAEEFLAGEIPSAVGPLPHHLICTTPVMTEFVTDLTVHLWDDIARIVIYRDWEPDTVMVGTVGYGPKFGDDLRLLIWKVEQRLQSIQDPHEAIDSLVVD